jgi:chromosome segregation ATPase
MENRRGRLNTEITGKQTELANLRNAILDSDRARADLDNHLTEARTRMDRFTQKVDDTKGVIENYRNKMAIEGDSNPIDVIE